MFDYYLTADDVLANSVDNMSDEEIDRDVKLFRRIAQKLGIRNYNDLIVVPGEDDYNPDYYAQPLGIFSTNLYKNNDSIKVCSVDGIDFVAEELNGTLYLYFKDETTASKYKDMVDEFNSSYSEGTNESLNEELDFEEWEEIASKQVQDFDGFWTDYTMYYNKDEDRFVCIFGDRDLYDPTNTEPDFECETEREAREWFDDYDTGESDGEDDTIYEPQSNESLKESKNVNLNESLSQYYKIGDKGNELIYTISSLRYSGESESSDPYAVVYMTLVCGWDYCSDWSDKMGWVDPENWVEDVQTDYFIVYLSDGTIEQALADNGYTPTSKPSPIYHYNEEKDRWEVLKESLSIDKYIRKSLNELDNKAINEDTKFYDLRSLYEAFSNKLTQEQKQELKKVIDSTDDAEIIAAAIDTKTKNEDLDLGSDDIFGDEPDNNYSVSAFLTRKGYQNYLGLYDDLWTDDLSEAEGFIWDSLQKGFYVEFNDYTTIKTKGYATIRYFNPEDLDETTVDYTELEESVSLKEKRFSDRANEVRLMHQTMMYMNNENAYYGLWISLGVPDGAVDSDFEDIAADKDDYREIVDLFNEEFKEYAKDGLVSSAPEDVKQFALNKCEELNIPSIEILGESLNEDSSEQSTPIEKQMRTERGLIYVKGSYPSREAAREAGYDYAFHSRDLGKDLFSKTTKDINHREFVIIDESLTEKLVDPSEEIRNEFLSILNKHGFELDKDYRYENPSKNLFGGWHYQVINPNLMYEDSNQLRNELIPLIDELHEFEERVDCPITWNFGPNKDNVITAGLDISEQWVPDDSEN